jgi:2-polyprenyl-3-methyl-5-hydroxy-6-metoxy-1,4-benzoquinol methylase
MMPQPRLGDAFGELMRAALAEEAGAGLKRTVGGTLPGGVVEIVERDDGFIQGAPAARYPCRPDQWHSFDLRALELFEGRTIDIGSGAGRFALALQDRGIPVVGLDVSVGTVEVAAARGVRETICATVEEHAAAGPERYDCFALFGNNLGLLESRERAPSFLAALAAMANPATKIIAQGMDPYGTEDDLHLAYHAANQAAGRFAGQLRLRVRYRGIATDWFDYLLCTPGELEDLVGATPWRIEDVDRADAPFYTAVLRLR